MFIEWVYLILIVLVCLLVGFKVGSFLEARYYEAYIELNKDQEIVMLKHIITHKDIRIDELVSENYELHKYKRWYAQDNCEEIDEDNNEK